MKTKSRKVGRPKDPDLEVRRKAEILDVAAIAFAELGFANAQVQTIAERLGVGNGTIYRYFGTKEQLFLAAVERGLIELHAEMDRVLLAEGDPLAQFKQAVLAYLQFFAERPHMAELFIQERAAFPLHHRPLYFQTKDLAGQAKHDIFFRRLHATGRIRNIPQERFMVVVGDLLYGTILTNLLAGRPVDPKMQTQDILDIILKGMLKPISPKRTRKQS